MAIIRKSFFERGDQFGVRAVTRTPVTIGGIKGMCLPIWEIPTKPALIRVSLSCIESATLSASKAYDAITMLLPANGVSERTIAAFCSSVSRRGWICASNTRLADWRDSTFTSDLVWMVVSIANIKNAAAVSAASPRSSITHPASLVFSGKLSFSQYTPSHTATFDASSMTANGQRQDSAGLNISIWALLAGGAFNAGVFICLFVCFIGHTGKLLMLRDHMALHLPHLPSLQHCHHVPYLATSIDSLLYTLAERRRHGVKQVIHDQPNDEATVETGALLAVADLRWTHGDGIGPRRIHAG
jgi:hypothetical protein